MCSLDFLDFRETSILQEGRVRPVTILYTGGTIGMEQGKRGWRPAGSFSSLVSRYCPGLLGESDVLVEYDPPIDSADVGPDLWYKIGRDCARVVSSGHGVVVVHGTDTLSWTAASLSLQQVAGKGAVAITGSMIPLGCARTDGLANLTQALNFARDLKNCGVAVCFGGRTIPGVQSRKVSSSLSDAFRDVAFLAGDSSSFHISVPHDLVLGPPAATAVLPDVAFVFLHPGISARSLLVGVSAQSPAGLVLECFGMGTAPVIHGLLAQELHNLVYTGTLVLAVSQCMDGIVDFDRYEVGAVLRDAGVISGLGMTREAAFAKMHLVLSHGICGHQAVDLLQRNFCGETGLVG